MRIIDEDEISEDKNLVIVIFRQLFYLSKGYISNSGASLLTISKDKSIEDWEYRERNIFDADGRLYLLNIVIQSYLVIQKMRQLGYLMKIRSMQMNHLWLLMRLWNLILQVENLKEGDYIILPPDIDIENLNEDEFYNNSIGHIEVTKYSILGYLLNKSYIDKLDRVVILYENFENDELTFEIVSDKDRPTLKIQKIDKFKTYLTYIKISKSV